LLINKTMNQQKPKNKIVKSINQCNNELLLAEIYDMLNTDLSKNEHKLSEGEKESLTRGVKDFEEGSVLSNEEVRKPYAKYFK